MRRAGGFTLIEMLVVFGIFAFIGLVSFQIVSRVIDNQQSMR
jgi:prepilin-type N-terminal cleavage/methylation domain-containing protein